MSSDIVIKVTNVTKAYKVFSSNMDRLRHALYGPWGNKKHYKTYKALNGIDLEIKAGETVGIVGANGAGKSTLLQIICGTLQPDEGEVFVNGRISPLLELGASFNLEFTGRENVSVNALLMGLSEDELKNRFEDILHFADIGDYIDQPVKTYSSGMFARLAFAVAIHTDPDILVIDETLSVGDEAFQRKCFARLEALKNKGVTILFVSHSAHAVQELCERAVLLVAGNRVLTADSSTVIKLYQKLLYAPAQGRNAVLDKIRVIDDKYRAGEPVADNLMIDISYDGEGEENSNYDIDDYEPSLVSQSVESYVSCGAQISMPRIINADGNMVNVLRTGENYFLEYRVEFTHEALDVRFSMLIKTAKGVELAALWSAPRGKGMNEIISGQQYVIQIPFTTNLLAGVYFVNAGIAGIINYEYLIMHRLVDAVMFRIKPKPFSITDRYVNISTGDAASVMLIDDACVVSTSDN